MEDTPTQKRCRQCGAEKPTTNEFFGVDNSQPDALRKICKQCYAENRSGKTQTQTPEAKRLKTAQTHRCRCET